METKRFQRMYEKLLTSSPKLTDGMITFRGSGPRTPTTLGDYLIKKDYCDRDEATEAAEYIFKVLEEKQKEEEEKQSAIEEEEVLTAEQKQVLNDYILIKDIDRGSEGITNCVDLINKRDYTSLKEQGFSPTNILNLSNDKLRTFVDGYGLTARTVWEPDERSKLVEKTLPNSGVRYHQINLYREPLWLEKYPQPLKEWNNKPPQVFIDLLDHLIKTTKGQSVIQSWCSNALRSSNESLLNLRGGRGTGKSSLAKLLIAVVGYPYSVNEATNFNAGEKNKRLIFRDDPKDFLTFKQHKARKTAGEKLKSFNEKHKQSTGITVNHASTVVTSNISDKCYVEYDERLMVMPDLKDIMVKDPESKISIKDCAYFEELAVKTSNFYAGMGDEFEEKDLKFLAQIGHFLLNRAPCIGTSEAYLEETFWGDVLQSLNGFTHYICTKIINHRNNTDLDYYDLWYEYNLDSKGEKKTQFRTLKNFFETFLYKGEQLVVEIDTEYQKFIVNPSFTDKLGNAGLNKDIDTWSKQR